MAKAERKFQMLMSKALLFSLLPMLFCCQSNGDVKNIDRTKNEPKIAESISVDRSSIGVDQKEKTQKTTSNVVPDTTVNSKIYLENYESTSQFYDKNKSLDLVERIRESPVAIFLNKSGQEYLLAYQYEGSTEKAFSCFEIGYFKDEKSLAKAKSIQTTEVGFETESGLHLGMSLENLKKIKGNDFEIIKLENFVIVKYKIDNFETSPFLRKYNMPGYFIEAHSKNNRISKIKFGFDYP